MEDTTKNKNTGNKIFYTILALLILASVGVTFYKIVILKNYQIVAQVSCNPATEKCFETDCDPTTDSTCTATSTPTYYKNISKNAGTIYNCEQTAEKIGCSDELSCTSGEKDCSYTYCDPAHLEDGDECAK